MSFLYIVATPIGNLEDLTFRALRVLKEVDLILVEDTRRAKKLFFHYKIEKPLLSYHQHSKSKRVKQVLELLKKGKNVALVCDAGTPGVSDPGSELVKKAREELGENVKIVPVPGPSALIAAASICGFPMDRFLFLGFLPKKKKRKEIFQKIAQSEYPVIFYESPYRLLRTLEDLKNWVGEKEVVVAKELTKKFEKIFLGRVSEVVEKIKKEKIKGEFVVVVGK